MHRRACAASASFPLKQLAASASLSAPRNAATSSRLHARRNNPAPAGQRLLGQQQRRYASSNTPRDVASTAERQAPTPADLPNIPREDYATPAMYTFGIMGRLFRYSIYASVIVALGGTSLYLSVQAYVEYIALHGWSPITVSEDDASIFPLDDLVPAYSGAHLGGGTDPSIGWKARFAARGAWIALNLRQGGVVSGTKGRMADVAVPDKAWLEAERYLVYALEQCAEVLPQEASRQPQWELLSRLAEVRSKLAGPRGLGDARRNYQQLIMEMRESSKSSEPLVTSRILEYETRLAEVELRIVRELMTGKATEGNTGAAQASAISRLMTSISNTSSGVTAIVGATAPITVQETPAKSSWFGAGSKATLDILTLPASKDQYAVLVSTLDARSASELAPVVQRSVAYSLVSLTSSLATSGALPQAQALTNAAMRWLGRMTASSSPAQSEASRLHTSWLAIRQATLQMYAGEIAYGIQSTQTQTAAPDDTTPASFLAEAAALCHAILQQLPTLPKTSLLSTSSPYQLPLEQVHHSASRTGAMALYTQAILLERGTTTCREALLAHERALEFLPSTIHRPSSEEEAAALRARIVDGIRRCRERLRVA